MYSKLFAKILNSSIWSEDAVTCKVWITLLAMADREGYIFGSPVGVARQAGVSIEQAVAALEKFKGPDLMSSDLASNPENGGRRIEVTGEGWRLINYSHYSSLKDSDEQRLLAREKKRKQREVKKPPKSQGIEK